MAAQQGLAFLSGGEAQEALSDPSQPEGIANANTSSAQHVGPERHSSGRQSFEALSRLSHQTNSKTATTAGGTSRQAIYKAQGKKDAKDADSGETQIVHLDKPLTLEERQLVVKHALATEDQDAEGLLNNIRARMERVGIHPPGIEVRFQDIHIETSVYTNVSRNLPSILNAYRGFFEYILVRLRLLRPEKRKITILNKVSSILSPGRATLLLGPPGGGKSTLLKSLAGKLKHEGLKLNGSILYNGTPLTEFLPERTAVYVEQEDQHLPELTVRETFDFAARCQGVGVQAELLADMRKREKEMDIEPDWNVHAFQKAQAIQGQANSVATEYVIRMLGLDICADTICGNHMMRGISGGQKKRVTSGEMMVGAKQVLFMDEISTGLDSSTTYSIVKFLRDQTHALNYTTLISLLQPAPESYDLFDDILLLSEGYLVYHGPRENVMEFFESLGFACPERKGVADFLQEVTSRKDQKQYWSSSSPYRYYSVPDFAEEFKKFHVGRSTLERLAQTPDRAELEKQANGRELLIKKKYALTNGQLFKACWERELVLVKRNAFLYIFRFFLTMFMAFVTATLFLRTQLHADSVAQGQLYFSVVFFSLIMLMFDGFAEMTFTILRLDGFYKQRDNYFYPAWAYVWPTVALRLPYSLLLAILWSAIVYYPVGLAPEASRFFTYVLLLFMVHSMGIGMFRALGALARNEVVASTGGSFFFLILLLVGGFLLAKGSIPDWWIWAYWADPISYLQTAMALNEFLAPRWKNLDAGGISASSAILGARQLPQSGWWIWLGVAVLGFTWFLFNVACWLFHAYLNPLSVKVATLPEEQVENEAELRQEREGDTAPVKEPTTGGNFSNAPINTVANGNSQKHLASQPNLNGKNPIMTNGHNLETAVSVANANDPHINPNDDHFLIPPRFSTTGANPDLHQAGLPHPGLTHPHHVPVAPPVHPRMSPAAQPESQDAAQPVGRGASGLSRGSSQDLGAPQQSRGSMEMNSRKSLGSRRSLGSRGNSKKQMSLSAMRSTRELNGGAAGGGQGEKGMVLPFDPLHLTFHDLNYYVDLPKGVSTDPEKLGPKAAVVDGKNMLQLLNHCSGSFRPGILTALVGSSGAGKTTLMDVLAGRKTTGKIDGDVRVSGHPKVQKTFARVMGYVEQSDIHSPWLTVHESLIFSARLRFEKHVDLETVYAFVQEIMELVELEPLNQSLVGRPGIDGLSVEQRKRLTIAVELVANPSIVFMDEPTSGLDARAAAIVMRTVRNTVNTGRTVVCTIHQPSIDIFEAFDDLLLMKSGGYVTYHGNLGKQSCKLVAYFESIEGVPRLTEGLNPATWMLQVSTPGMEANIGVNFSDIYKQSQLYQENEQLIQQLSIPKEGSAPLSFKDKYPQPYLVQFRMIFWKFWISYWRNVSYNGTRFIFACVMGLLVGSILYKVAHHKNTQQDLGNILGALYLAMLFLGIINSMTVQPVAFTERSIMYRERASGMYHELPFALAQCAIEIPYNFIQTLLFGAISYYMMGFAGTAGKFFWYIFIIDCTLNLMVFYGIMGVYVTADLSLANVLSSFFYGLWNLFTGFLIGVNAMAGWWKWYYYINPLAWTLYGIIVTQLGDETNLITVPGGTPTNIKDFLHDNFGYDYSFIGPVVGILFGFTIFFAGLGILCLMFINYQKR